MKYTSLCVLALTLLLPMSVEAGNLKMLTDSIKKPMTITAGESMRMNVVFNHTSHRGINCFTCHHMKSEKGRYVSCSECHKGAGRSSDPTSRFAAFHARDSKHSCYSCHTSLVAENPARYGQVFYNCRPCHMPQSNSAASK
ncbi:MAG: cytochrome c3 family protein [Desulfovibrio sp.]|nr:cytochrome c3 family protein [Desulfovibrio sp.]